MFAQKMKTAPPKGFGCRSCEGVAVIQAKNRLNFGENLLFFFLEIICFWAEKPFDFPIPAEKSLSISVKTDHFFWRSSVLGRKNRLIFRFRPKNPSQFRKNDLILIQEQRKFGSRTLTVVSLFLPFRNPGYAPGQIIGDAVKLLVGVYPPIPFEFRHP